jgi:hypothetical protein
MSELEYRGSRFWFWLHSNDSEDLSYPRFFGASSMIHDGSRPLYHPRIYGASEPQSILVQNFIDFESVTKHHEGVQNLVSCRFLHRRPLQYTFRGKSTSLVA